MQFTLKNLTTPLTLAVRDCIKPRMLLLLSVPLCVAFVCVLVFWNWGIDILQSATSHYGIVHDNDNPIWTFLFDVLLVLLNSMLSLFSFIIIVVITQMILSLFYSPFLMGYLQKKYYKTVSLDAGLSFFESILMSLKLFGGFALTLLLCIPLYLIPIVNGIILFIVLFFFFKATLTLDVFGTLFSRDDSNRITKTYRLEIGILALVLYLLSLIPFINFFVAIFQILAFGHYAFLKKIHHISRVE